MVFIRVTTPAGDSPTAELALAGGLGGLLRQDKLLPRQQGGPGGLGGRGEWVPDPSHLLVTLLEPGGPLLDLRGLLLGERGDLERLERGLLGLTLFAAGDQAGALFGTGIPKLQLQHGPGVITPPAKAKGKGLNNGVLAQVS